MAASGESVVVLVVVGAAVVDGFFDFVVVVDVLTALESGRLSVPKPHTWLIRKTELAKSCLGGSRRPLHRCCCCCRSGRPLRVMTTRISNSLERVAASTVRHSQHSCFCLGASSWEITKPQVHASRPSTRQKFRL